MQAQNRIWSRQQWISACSGATLWTSLGEPGGSCRQTPLGNKPDCHWGGACAALGHLGSVLGTELLKISGQTATRASTTITPRSHLTDQWAYTPCKADTHWNPPKEPASSTPLLVWAIILIPLPQSPSQTSYYDLCITLLEVFVKPAPTSSGAAPYSRHHSSKTQVWNVPSPPSQLQAGKGSTSSVKMPKVTQTEWWNRNSSVALLLCFPTIKVHWDRDLYGLSWVRITIPSDIQGLTDQWSPKKAREHI